MWDTPSPWGKNYGIPQATVDNNAAGARRIKKMI